MAEPTNGVRFAGTARDSSGSLITSGITANSYATGTTTPAVGTEDSTFTNGKFSITDHGFGRADIKLLNGTDEIWWNGNAEVQVTTLQARNPTTASSALEVFSTTSEAQSLVATFGFRPATESSGVETADTPSDGDRGYINFELSNDNTTPQQWVAGRFEWEGTDVSDGTEDGQLNWWVMKAGTITEVLNLDSGALFPTVTDTVSLGTSSLNFSDVFLDSGAVINFDSGDFTITHSSGTLTFSGAVTVTGTTTLNGNLVLGDAAADTLQIGATITGATPMAFEGATADGFETSFAITDPTADRTITFPDASITVNAAANISGTTLASNVVTTSVTTVGALNSGSITSGFGNIDNGSSTITTTGTITGGELSSGNDLALTSSGAIVNFNSGDITLTHSNDKLTFGGSGNAQLIVDGNQTNSALEVPASGGTNGMLSVFAFTEDNIAVMWDAVYDSGFKSKDAGSSFAIYKQGGDVVRFVYDTAAVDGAISWNNAMQISLLDGGIFMNNLLAASASTDVNINGSSELHSVTSSAHYKRDIRDVEVDTSRIYDINLRTYEQGRKNPGAPEDWPEGPEEDQTIFGTIVEQVAEVFPELVNYRDGRPWSLNHMNMTMALLAEVQKLRKVA